MINDDIQYVFTIDVLKPSTAPMLRVAQYMAELARLLGSEADVHINEIRESSLRYHVLSEHDAVPVIDDRLATVEMKGSEANKHFNSINVMLRADKAVARLDRVSPNRTAQIIRFPGRELPVPRTFKVRQEGTLDGYVVKIGGKDKTAHATLEAGNGRYWRCTLDRELAADLAQHLFKTPVRVSGICTWLRDEEGVWTQDSDFQVREFHVLVDESLPEVLDKLREINTDWAEPEVLAGGMPASGGSSDFD